LYSKSTRAETPHGDKNGLFLTSVFCQTCRTFAALKLQKMPYPEQLCAPMRQELTAIGFTELKDAQQVDQAFAGHTGTMLLVVNSVCGCAAGAARPGVRQALSKSGSRPDQLVTVFAGQDVEATSQARKFLAPYPPSSPCVALMRDGKVVHMLERHHIEGHSADMIAENLSAAIDEYCGVKA
jgi:putative YphP/YqiW family bacilliredoxin